MKVTLRQRKKNDKISVNKGIDAIKGETNVTLECWRENKVNKIVTAVQKLDKLKNKIEFLLNINRFTFLKVNKNIVNKKYAELAVKKAASIGESIYSKPYFLKLVAIPASSAAVNGNKK